MDWTEKGRGALGALLDLGSGDPAEWSDEHLREKLGEHFAEALAAARWGAARVELAWQTLHDDRCDPDPDNPDPFWAQCATEAADRAEAEALRLLVEGVRDRLQALAGPARRRAPRGR